MSKQIYHILIIFLRIYVNKIVITNNFALQHLWSLNWFAEKSTMSAFAPRRSNWRPLLDKTAVELNDTTNQQHCTNRRIQIFFRKRQFKRRISFFSVIEKKDGRRKCSLQPI